MRVLLVLSLAILATGLPDSTSAHPGSAYLPGVPLLRQQHPLTCEASATSMATREQLTEGQIMAALPRNPNPNLGFRGNPNGVQGQKLVDYGVYAMPLQKAMLRYGYRTDVVMYGNDGVLRSYIDQGWPVVVWVTYALKYATPRLQMANGTQFFLVPWEHTVTVVGYTGASVIANDPWTANRVAYGWKDFNRAWGYFANMALAVEPCPLPAPVSSLDARFSPTSVTWSWGRAAHATSYDVTVLRLGTTVQVVYEGRQQATQFTLAAPSPGKRYEIDVTSVSPCGGTASPQRLAVKIPRAIPTPTATPPEGTVTPPSTPGPSPTTPVSTAVPRSTVTATPSP